MADEFQAEVCGGRWWNIPSRSMFAGVSLSPCASAGISDFGWQHSDVLVDMKLARSSTTTTTTTDESGSASDGSIVIQDMQKPPPNLTESAATGSLQILGIGLSSPSSTTDEWNRALLHGTSNGRSETTNYPPMLMPEEDQNPCSMNYRQEAGMEDVPSCPAEDDWNLKNFSTLNKSLINSNIPNNSTSTKCTTTCGHEQGGGLSTGFPISSASYGYSSALLQTLFADDPDNPPQPQQSLLYGNRSMSYPANPENNYQLANLNEFLPPEFLPLTNSSLPKQTNSLQFLNRNITNFCTNNASSTPAASNDFRPIPFASQSQTTSTIISDQKPNLLKVIGHGKPNNEDVQGMAGSSVAKKSSSNEPASFKRPRIETPSPLPTFKVRKEKLGDRITALQQLVSPFGKTDTASVLHEAIEYIKFLHDQVGVLSTPYLRNGGSPVVQRQQTCDIKTKDQEGLKQDLRSRGLCLVPISSTFPVAAENTTDFWTPTFGGTFR